MLMFSTIAQMLYPGDMVTVRVEKVDFHRGASWGKVFSDDGGVESRSQENRRTRPSQAPTAPTPPAAAE
eukprot:1387350-Amorphochlora_amoeboformis.AAC.1